MRRYTSGQRGFTLVEAALVLVIIGLVAGAVSYGQRLLTVAQTRRIIAEVSDYQKAVSAYEDKYKSLPGDMVDAESIWGAGATNNGDGDGSVEWATDEGVQGWQHLELAGFIEEGGLSGTASSALAVIGTNVPASDYGGGNGGYYLDSAGSLGNHIGFGAADGASENDGPIITPEMARDIDAKFDDGIGNQGRVMGVGGSCTSSGAYAVSTSSVVCALEIKLEMAI